MTFQTNGFRLKSSCCTKEAQRRKYRTISLITTTQKVLPVSLFQTVLAQRLREYFEKYRLSEREHKCSHMYAYLRSLYINVAFNVKPGKEKSESAHLTCGLRQGCPLSPILFIMFINPLIKLLRQVGGVIVPALHSETTKRGNEYGQQHMVCC